jgi:hypothetical protein
MAGLDRAIHVFSATAAFKAWMPATGAGMTLVKIATAFAVASSTQSPSTAFAMMFFWISFEPP